MSFSVATYNVLANAYVRESYYPRTPEAVLEPAQRLDAVLERVAGLGTDVICLQEVEQPLFDRLVGRMSAMGYEAEFAGKKGPRQPDGCATLVRRSAFTLMETHAFHYADGVGGMADSGHLALVLVVERDGRTLAIANTHLKWDLPGEKPTDHYGYRQLRLLLLERERILAKSPWLLCGDLNVTPEDDAIRLARSNGFAFAAQGSPKNTCQANDKAKKVDYLLHTTHLVATPSEGVKVKDSTLLPSETEPSDHVPLTATFKWLGGAGAEWGHSAKGS